MDLTEFKRPGRSSSNIAYGDVKAEEPKELEESNISEGTNESEESKNELQKLWDKNTSLLDAIATQNDTDVLSLLANGANPNATCRFTLTSACHVAAFSNEKALQILLDSNAERRRYDRKGFTPLHYAACANSPRKIAMILGFPEGLTKAATRINHTLTPEQEAEIQEIARVNGLVDGTGAFDSALPDEWMTNDDGDFDCLVPSLEPGCSALHAASRAAHPQCVRLLLAAGADPNLRDKSNSTPLDVAGASSSDDNVQYVATLQLLRKYGGSPGRVDNLVLERALRKRSLEALKLLLYAGALINYRNPSGYTPMHLCVEMKLKEHLQVLANHSSPEMDCRAVDVTDEEGSTVLHWAAREGWSDGVTVALLARADITHKNSVGDTALHLAAKAGDYDIVKQILDHDTNRDCDFSKENVKGESPFSYAIFSGKADIVRLMLAINNEMRDYFNKKVGDLTPLEYASEKKFQELFILILNEQNDLLDIDEMFRIVNVIAKNNIWELFALFKNLKAYSMKNNISKNYYTLHEAMKKQIVFFLLEKGADLSQRNEYGQTAISFLVWHVTKPTELMTEVLDECIKIDDDEDIPITINYNLLMPVNEYENIGNTDSLNTKDMKVLEALIEIGNVFGERRLLTHPIVESFLYLKWKKWTKFIYFQVAAYVLFLISFNMFIGTIFYNMDNKIKEQDVRSVLNPYYWGIPAMILFFPLSLVEHLYVTSSKEKKCLTLFGNPHMWLKWLSTILEFLMILCIIPYKQPSNSSNYIIAIRGLAALAVLSSWNKCIYYSSWIPKFGYYFLIYEEVANNVLKVMTLFFIPVLGFAVVFMILQRFQWPFNGPVAAFFKILVMMTSDFDYENLVRNTENAIHEDTKNLLLDAFAKQFIVSSFVLLLHVFFLLFFLFGAIVLMNVLLGIAVSNLQKPPCDIKQLWVINQVARLNTLETLYQQRLLSTFKSTEKETMKVPSVVEVKLDSKIFSKKFMKKIILKKAQSLKETEEKRADDVGVKVKIDDIKLSDLEKKLSEITNSVMTILNSLELKNNIASEKR